MTTPTGDSPATMECQVCQTEVPAGEFCGLCGDHLTERRGTGPSWLRIRAYGAAPGEHLLRPSLASSLFPQLPHRSRTPFRIVEPPVVHRRLRQAGEDAVDADLPAGVVRSHRADEADNAGLARRVGAQLRRDSELSRRRANAHDRAAALFEQCPCAMFGDEKGAGEVDVDSLPPSVELQAVDAVVAANQLSGGVHDHDVQAAELLHGPAHSARDGRFVGRQATSRICVCKARLIGSGRPVIGATCHVLGCGS